MPHGIQTLDTDIVADLQMEQKSSSQCQKLPASSFCHLRTPSQFPSPISTDSLCSSFGMAGNSCSCSCRVLQKIQVIFYSFDLLMSAVCWHLPASSLLSNTNSLTQYTSSSQDHHLYRPARTPEVALTQGLWCIRRVAPDDARNCARWYITSTAEHKTILSRVSDSLLHHLLCNLLCLLAVSGSSALGPALTCALP